MSGEQIRLKVPPKLFRVNSWIMQMMRQCIPDCWFGDRKWLINVISKIISNNSYSISSIDRGPLHDIFTPSFSLSFNWSSADISLHYVQTTTFFHNMPIVSRLTSVCAWHSGLIKWSYLIDTTHTQLFYDVSKLSWFRYSLHWYAWSWVSYVLSCRYLASWACCWISVMLSSRWRHTLPAEFAALRRLDDSSLSWEMGLWVAAGLCQQQLAVAACWSAATESQRLFHCC